MCGRPCCTTVGATGRQAAESPPAGFTHRHQLRLASCSCHRIQCTLHYSGAKRTRSDYRPFAIDSAPCSSTHTAISTRLTERLPVMRGSSQGGDRQCAYRQVALSSISLQAIGTQEPFFDWVVSRVSKRQSCCPPTRQRWAGGTAGVGGGGGTPGGGRLGLSGTTALERRTQPPSWESSSATQHSGSSLRHGTSERNTPWRRIPQG